MTQYRSLDFRAQADAAEFNRQMKGVAPRGPRSGFRVVPGSAGYVSIEAGVLFTREGIRIEETATLTDELAITPPAAGMTRIDRIVCRHTYVATYPGVAAYYDVVTGAEVASAADAVPPAEPADAETLALATIADEATDYDAIAPTGRPDEGRMVFTLGDGEVAVGDFNGWAGWVALVEAYRDVAIEVVVIGGFAGAGTFVIPSCWRVRGVAGAVLGGTGDPVVAFENRVRSGGTNAGTAQLDDSGGEFAKLSTNAVIMIQTGPDAGTYVIAARTSDTRLVLANPDGSTPPSFAGGGCNYLAICQSPEVWHLMVVQIAAGGRGIDWSYTGGACGRNIVVAASGDPIAEGFYTTASNFLVLDNCRTEGSMTDALKDGGYSAGARVNHFQAEAGNVTWVTWECQLEDIRTPGTVSAGGPTGSGGIGWPFSTAHNPDGTQADDSVPEDAIVDGAVTRAKIANNAVDEDKLNTSVAGAGLTGGGGNPLAANPDGSTIALDGDEFGVPSGGIGTDQIAAYAVTPDKINHDLAGPGMTFNIGGQMEPNPDNVTIGIVGDFFGALAGGIGHTQLGHRPSARIGVTGATQTATKEAWTRVDFDDSEWNTLPGAVTGSGASWKYTASRTQILRVSAIVDLGATGGVSWTTPNILRLRLRHYDDSGATTRTYTLRKMRSDGDGVTSGNTLVDGTTLVKLDTDDYLYVEVWHDNANDADIEGDTAISIEEV